MRRSTALLLVAAAGLLIVLLYLSRWFTFWTDEWSFILERREPSLSAWLAPDGDHFSLVSVLVYQALFRLVGLRSYLPYLAVAWALHLTTVWLLFRVNLRLAGREIALMSALSLLLLGSGWENLLHAFQLSFLLAESAGLASLGLTLRATTPTGRSWDRYAAAGLLCISVASSGVGLLFLELTLITAVLRRDRGGIAASLPAVLVVGLWLMSWGPADRLARVTSSDLVSAPAGFLYGLGAAFAGVGGLPPHRFALVGLLLGAGALAGAWWLRARPGVVAVAAAVTLLSQLALESVFRASFGAAHAARSTYVYLAVIFLWLIGADLVARSRLPLGDRRVRLVGAVALALAIAANMVQLVRAAEASRPLRVTRVLHIRLLEALRDSPELDVTATFIAGSPGRVARYLGAFEALGWPHLACCEPSLAHPGAADARVLDASLTRLVGASLTEAPIGILGDAPPHPVVHGGAITPGSHPSCVAVSGARPLGPVVRGADGEGLAIRLTAPADAGFAYGVFAPPGERPPPATLHAFRAGRLVRFPLLPPGLAWTFAVDLPADAVLEVCRASPEPLRRRTTQAPLAVHISF